MSTEIDEKALGTLLDLLRAKGVRSFDGAGMRLELFPAEPSAPATPPALEAEPAPCACGHAHFEHSDDGMCLKGCDVEACAPPEKVTT